MLKIHHCVSLHVEEFGNGVQLSWAYLQKLFIDLPGPTNLTFLHVSFVHPAMRLLHGVLKTTGQFVSNASERVGSDALG